MKRMDIIIKLAETEIDKYIIDIEFEQYSLSCASNMATTNGYWSFTDNQAFYLFLSFLGACTYIINRFQYQLCLALGSITGSQLVLWLLQRSFYTIRILNFYMYLLNRPITLKLLVMAEPPISQQLCKIAAVNKLPRSIQSRIYSNKTICSI